MLVTERARFVGGSHDGKIATVTVDTTGDSVGTVVMGDELYVRVDAADGVGPYWTMLFSRKVERKVQA